VLGALTGKDEGDLGHDPLPTLSQRERFLAPYAVLITSRPA
jgi:hypothetical protein